MSELDSKVSWLKVFFPSSFVLDSKDSSYQSLDKQDLIVHESMYL